MPAPPPHKTAPSVTPSPWQSLPVNTAELLVDGQEILPAVLEDLRAARCSIHISVFLWFRDPIGEELADLLIQKAKAGVACRVLLNVDKTGMGDPFSTGEKEMMEHDPSVTHNPLDVEPMFQRLTDAGVEVVNTNIDYDKVIDGVHPRLVSVAAQIKGAIAIDELHIDHRKLVLIDNCVAYCGGANIGAQYLYHDPFDANLEARLEGEQRLQAALPEPWWKWHDSWTRFEGPVTHELEAYFHDRFVLDGGTDYELARAGSASSSPPRPGAFRIGAGRIEVYANQPDNEPNAVRELYLRLIREATRSIFIENPYFYHPDLVNALCQAKRNRPDLDVTLVLPAANWNDNSFAQDAQQYWYSTLLEHGVDVHEYQNHFTHLKIAVFDERWSIHGSTNGNYRSMENDKDFELVVLIDDEPLARDILERVLAVDVARSRRITGEAVHDVLGGLRIRNRDPRTLLLISRASL
jgi:cardiolipin synthase A/B